MSITVTDDWQFQLGGQTTRQKIVTGGAGACVVHFNAINAKRAIGMTVSEAIDAVLRDRGVA